MQESIPSAHDKIRILLIDDMPDGLPAQSGRSAPNVPAMDSAYAEWFEFRWLATPQESREYRDLSWLVGQQNPLLLADIGWVPEILVIDYALTQDTRTVDTRVNGDAEFLEILSPLPGLRRWARSFANDTPVERDAFPFQPQAGTEYWGCFIGGLLMNTFDDYPCAPVTITRYSQEKLATGAPDAAFFEWLMDVQSSGLLRAKGVGKSPDWQYVIPHGVANLRHRLRALAKANVVQISLGDLLDTVVDGAHQKLTVTSRYGRRRYPMEGLFVDVPPESRTDKASLWAREVLGDAWSSVVADESPTTEFEQTVHDLIQGREFANVLWDAYCDNDNDLFEERLRLSELMGRATGKSSGSEELNVSEKAELHRLITHFNVADPQKKNPKCGERYVDIRHHDYDSRARRWAVLMVVIRLLHYRYRATLAARRLAGRRHDHHSLPLASSLTPADVYMALFPIAQTPLVLPWHSRNADPASSWGKYLAELDLDLKQVLEGRGPQAAKHHERVVLRMYAESVGAERGDWRLDDWKRDTITSNVLYGATERT